MANHGSVLASWLRHDVLIQLVARWRSEFCYSPVDSSSGFDIGRDVSRFGAVGYPVVASAPMNRRIPKLLFGAMLGRRLPVTEGVLEIEGPEAPIRIDRDVYGIPHIHAATSADAWFGLGFCQGQDRSFQIDTLVRVVRGTTAKLAGEETVPLDRLARRIGFRRAAAASWELVSGDERRGLKAFALGVNAGRDESAGRKAHEFTLLRGEPEPLDPEDILGIGALQAFGLAANWDAELARFEILVSDGEAALAAVDPGYPEWHPVTASPQEPAGAPIESLRAALEMLREVVDIGGGSNNWAVSGSRTATGRPLLANDPHLAPSLPPHWYLAHLITPQWGLSGACFAGTPGFASGHNGKVAWGVTAGLVDNTDLFIEELGADGKSVRRGEDFVQCTVLKERIEVRGSQTLIEEVLITPHGPIVGPVLVGAHETISMAATWLRPQRAGALLSLTEAESVGDLREILTAWSGPSLNVVAADTEGSIAWQLIGEAPVRKAGRGALPLPAWVESVGWEDQYLPYGKMPGVTDPAAGYVATANNRPTASDEPFLGVDWIEGYRLARINEVLEQGQDWDIASTLQAQLDTVTHAWRELREDLLRVGHTAETTTALAMLEPWDGDLASDSSAASVFVLWLTDMQRRVAETAAPNSVEAALGRGFAPAPIALHSLFAFGRTGHLVRLLRERPDGWFENWDDAIHASLAAAERQLRARFGSEAAAWQWGSVRPLTMVHVLGQRKPFDRLFNLGPIRWSGDFTTISQSGAPPLDPLGTPSAIASLRMAVDVGDWDNSRFSLPGGQSGNPLSPHYDDQVDLWRHGVGAPMPWTEEAVAAAATKTLLLTPRRA